MDTRKLSNWIVVIVVVLVAGAGGFLLFSKDRMIARFEIYDGKEALPEIGDAKILLFDKNDSLLDTVTIDDGGEYETLLASIAPNGKTLYYAVGFEGQVLGSMFSIKDKTIYSIVPYACTNRYLDWLNEGRFYYTTGDCDTGEELITYQSIDSEKPWIFEEVAVSEL